MVVNRISVLVGLAELLNDVVKGWIGQFGISLQEHRHFVTKVAARQKVEIQYGSLLQVLTPEYFLV